MKLLAFQTLLGSLIVICLFQYSNFLKIIFILLGDDSIYSACQAFKQWFIRLPSSMANSWGWRKGSENEWSNHCSWVFTCSCQHFSRFFSSGMGKIEHLEGICSLSCIILTKAILPSKVLEVLEDNCRSSHKFFDQLYLKLTLQKTRCVCVCVCVYTQANSIWLL